MAGALGRRACLNSSNVLASYLSKFSQTPLDQVVNGERCLSGASASTSALLPEPQHSLSRRHAAAPAPGLSSCSLGTFAPSEACGPAFAAPALRGFSSAAVAAAAPATRGTDHSAGTRSGATSGGAATTTTTSSSSSTTTTSSSRFQAPWPWVDPERPQVLPVSVGKKQRQPVPLPEALTRLLGALPPSERPRHSLEVFIRFRLDPRRSDHLVRGSVVLPYGTGREMKLVVFAKGADAEIARAEGVELIGDEELISAIVSTDGAAIAFDRLIATPDFMRPLARAGKVLGPKGLMPNPKMGTLTTDVAGAIRDIRRGRLDYRLSRESTVRAVLGRGSMTAEQLLANVGALVASLWENRPKVVAGPAVPAGAAGGAVAAGAAAGDGGSGGGGGAAASGVAAGGAQPGGGATGPTVAGLERYFMTFILKTTHSPSMHISFDSLMEAATKHHRPAATAAAGGGGAQKPEQEKKKQQ